MSTEVSSNNVPEQSSIIATNVIGSVKWFNNRFGYGFIVATGEHSSYGDVFVHHSELQISDPTVYKFLTQGEYIQFNIVKTSGGKHEYQAGNVTGVNGGKLLCENSPSTYRRSSRAPSADNYEEQRRPVEQTPRHNNYQRVPRESDDHYRPPSARHPRGARTPTGEDGFVFPRGRKPQQPQVPQTPRPTPYKNAVRTDRGGNQKS
jgi:cold shock CspA family protein